MSKGIRAITGIALIVVGLTVPGAQSLIIVGVSLTASALLEPDQPGLPSLPRGGTARRTTRDTVAVRRWPWGLQRTGGDLVYQGVDSRRFQQTLELGQGPQRKILAIYRDGERVSFAHADDNGRIVSQSTLPAEQRYRVIVPFGAERNKYGSRGWRMRYFPFGRDDHIKQWDDDIPRGWRSASDRQYMERMSGKAYINIECYQEDYGRDLDKRVWTQPPTWSFLLAGIELPYPEPVPAAKHVPFTYPNPAPTGAALRREWTCLVTAGSKLWMIEKAAATRLSTDAGMWGYARIWEYDPVSGVVEMWSHGFMNPEGGWGTGKNGEIVATRISGGRNFVYTVRPDAGGQFKIGKGNKSGIPQVGLNTGFPRGFVVHGDHVYIQRAGTSGPANNVIGKLDLSAANPSATRTLTNLPQNWRMAPGITVLGDTLYMIDAAHNNLVTINPDTMAYAAVGSLGALSPGNATWTGIAAVEGVIYGLARAATAITGPALFTIDSTTGTATPVTNVARILGSRWGRQNPDASRFFFRRRLGFPEDIVDHDSWVSARTVGQIQATATLPSDYNLNDYPRTFTLYEGGGMFSSGDDNVKTLAQLGIGMLGGFSEVGGIIYFNAGPAPGTDIPKTFTITPEDIARYGSMRASGAIQQKANGVSFQLDQSGPHQFTDFRSPIIRDTVALEEDGGRAYDRDLGNLVFFNNPIQGFYFSKVTLLQERDQRTFAPTLLPGRNRKNMLLRPYQRGTLMLPDYGLDNIDVMVWELRQNGGEDTVDVVFQESRAGKYTLDLEFPDELPVYTPEEVYPAAPAAPVAWISATVNAPVVDLE